MEKYFKSFKTNTKNKSQEEDLVLWTGFKLIISIFDLKLFIKIIIICVNISLNRVTIKRYDSRSFNWT